MTKIKLALVQFESSAEAENNRSTMASAVEDAAGQGANMVAFHEFATSNYFCYDDQRTENFELAETIPGPSTDHLIEVADRTGVSVVLPLYERDGDQRFNAVVYIEPGAGIVGKYRKTHVPQVSTKNGLKGVDEAFYFSPGDTGFVPADSQLGIRMGTMICYDRHFPEGARAYALDGVQIIFVPTASYRGFIIENLWEAELQTMAFQNGVYVAGINKVGKVHGEGVAADATYPGRSVLVDPNGQIVAQMDNKPGMLIVELDTDECDPGRSGAMEFLEKRRPEMYNSLVNS